MDITVFFFCIVLHVSLANGQKSGLKLNNNNNCIYKVKKMNGYHIIPCTWFMN